MAGVELATAWVNLAVTSKGIAAGIEKELGGPISAAADKAGKDAGAKIKGNLDKTAGDLTKFGGIATATAVAGGMALGKLAGNFQELGVKAGHMATVTGLSIEAASRLIEVSGDLGIEVGTVEGALGKLNKAAALTPEAFASIGAEIVRTKDGAVDVNATFMSTIDALNAIEDPAARQVAATALMGRGWQGMGELIAGGSASLTASMNAVADVKVFDDAKLQQAKDYRADIDAFKDSIEELGLSIGQGAAPLIGGLATGIGGLVDIVGKADAVTGGAAGTFLTFATAGVGVAGALSVVAGQAMKMKGRLTDAAGGLTGMGKAASFAAGGLVAVGVAVAGLELINNLTADAGKAEDALTGFIASTAGLGTGKDRTAALLNAWSDLSAEILDSKGIVDQTMSGWKSGFSDAEFDMNSMTQAFDAVMAKSPELAGELVSSMEAATAAAADGSEGAKRWLDGYGLSTEVVAKFRTKVDDAAGAVDVLTDITEDKTAADGMALAALDRVKRAQETFRTATEEATAAIRDQIQASLEAIGDIGDLEQQVRDVESGYIDLKAKIEANTVAQRDSKLSDDEKRQSQLDLESAVHAHAEEVLSLSAKYATETGAAATSKEAHDRQLAILLLNKAQYPELATEIDKYIVALGKIPTDVTTNVHLAGAGVKVGTGPNKAFAEGGFVPGPIGAPMAAIVHGGEYITPVGKVSTSMVAAASLGQGGQAPVVVNNYHQPLDVAQMNHVLAMARLQ